MEALENLVRINKLSHEPPDKDEFDGMVAAATTRLQDVNLVGLDKSKWRVLDKCHQCRNLAEYEGHLDIDEILLKELVSITHELLALVTELPTAGPP